MFLPLGFGSRIKKFPFMTMVIALICIVWSTMFFHNVDESSRQIMQLQLDGNNGASNDNEPANNKANDNTTDTTTTNNNKISKEQKLFLELLVSVCQERKREFCALLVKKEKTNQVATNEPTAPTESNEPTAPTESVETTAPTETSAQNNENVPAIPAPPKEKPDFGKILKESLSQLPEMYEFMAEFNDQPESWPQDVKNNPKYNEYMAYIKAETDRINAIHKKFGFFTSEAFSFMRLLRASFTHGGMMHLMSNLLMLLLIGVWVEQRAGATMTFALFLLGSFVGLAAQVLIAPDRAVLGASAGLFSLMGMFFIFFYHKEIRFLFSLFPFYFRVLSLPALWTFPFFYLLTDLIAVQAGTNSGVASWAHLGGLSVGLMVGFFLRRADELGPDEVYLEERRFIRKLKTEENHDKLWAYFKELMEWNCQNWTGLETFMLRAREMGIDLATAPRQKFMQKVLRVAAVHYLKRGDVQKMVDFIQSIPESVELEPCLKDTPVSQILFIADHLANAGNYPLARRLYVIAIHKESKKSVKCKTIQGAIDQIDQITNENENLNSRQEAQS